MKKLPTISQSGATLALFALLLLVFALGSPYFFTGSNLLELFAQMVEIGLLSMAMAASLFSGGMDLSIGAICSLSTVVIATLLGDRGVPVPLACLAAFALASLCGLLNGWMVAYLKVPSMLVTLGSSALYIGVGLVISKGMTVSFDAERFALFGRYRIAGLVPFQIVYFLVIAALVLFLFAKSKWSRRVMQIGCSYEAARYAGIRIKGCLVKVYLFSSTLAFLASLVIASRISSGRADVANAKVLMTVVACVLGGISTMGGSGKIAGAVSGVMVIAVLANGMDMLGLSRYTQQIALGAILVLSLALNRRSALKRNS